MFVHPQKEILNLLAHPPLHSIRGGARARRRGGGTKEGKGRRGVVKGLTGAFQGFPGGVVRVEQSGLFWFGLLAYLFVFL